MAKALKVLPVLGSAGATAGAIEGWRSCPDSLVTTKLGSAVGLGFLWGCYSFYAPIWFPLVATHNLDRQFHGLPPRDVWLPYKGAREMVGLRPR